MSHLFDHEKLEVYQKSIDFCAWLSPLLAKVPNSSSIHNQLDRASTSIALNIAEGNGKWSKKDRCRFFDTSRGSALECAAALDVGVARELLQAEDTGLGKALLSEVVRMQVGLIKANDPERRFG